MSDNFGGRGKPTTEAGWVHESLLVTQKTVLAVQKTVVFNAKALVCVLLIGILGSAVVGKLEEARTRDEIRELKAQVHEVQRICMERK